MTWDLHCTKKIERTLAGLKYQKYSKSQRQHIKVSIKLTLTDQFKQNQQFTVQSSSSRAKCPIRSLSSTVDESERIGHLAREDVQSSPRALNYRVSKDELKSQRTTLMCFQKIKKTITLCRCCIYHHHTNRSWTLGFIYHEMKESSCHFCDKREILDEFHYIFYTTKNSVYTVIFSVLH